MKTGDKALIMNQTMSGKPIEEGVATLVKKINIVNKCGGIEYWEVQFDDDTEGAVNRWVDPENINIK